MVTVPASEMTGNTSPSKVAVVGTGSVGASWVALLLANGKDVIAVDPAVDAEERAMAFVNSAWPALQALVADCTASPDFRHLRFGSIADIAQDASFIIEAAPERPALKQDLIQSLDAAAAASVPIATCTGGIRISDLQSGCRNPERIVLLHPLNPAHLIPSVEIGGSPQTAEWAIEAAEALCKALGKAPIRIRREAIGHITNRLQAALLREAIHCLVTGIATAEDIDAAVTEGLGARWATVGPLMTLHLAGGPNGMAGILAHAGEAMQIWWDDLGTPRLTSDTQSRLIEAADELANGATPAQLAAMRDAHLLRLFAAAPNKD